MATTENRAEMSLLYLLNRMNASDLKGGLFMEREPVDSTNLASVGYDPETQVLEIEFQSGGVYQYYDVPVELYEELMSASSHGSYFVHFIRDAEYRSERIQ